jgi:hypothetical protein
MKHILFLLFSLSIYAQDTIPATKSVIALDKMNVVYPGFSNPISIAVNDAKSYKIYGEGVSLNEEGKYIINPFFNRDEIPIFVEIENFDGSKIIEKHVFRPLLLEPICYTINDVEDQGNLVFFIEDLKNIKIKAKIKDLLFPVNIEVTGFDIKFPRNNTLTIDGCLFTDEVYELLKKARRKDIIIITKIRCKFKGLNVSFVRASSPIIFRVIKKKKDFYTVIL